MLFDLKGCLHKVHWQELFSEVRANHSKELVMYIPPVIFFLDSLVFSTANAFAILLQNEHSYGLFNFCNSQGGRSVRSWCSVCKEWLEA